MSCVYGHTHKCHLRQLSYNLMRKAHHSGLRKWKAFNYGLSRNDHIFLREVILKAQLKLLKSPCLLLVRSNAKSCRFILCRLFRQREKCSLIVWQFYALRPIWSQWNCSLCALIEVRFHFRDWEKESSMKKFLNLECRDQIEFQCCFCLRRQTNGLKELLMRVSYAH